MGTRMPGIRQLFFDNRFLYFLLRDIVWIFLKINVFLIDIGAFNRYNYFNLKKSSEFLFFYTHPQIVVVSSPTAEKKSV